MFLILMVRLLMKRFLKGESDKETYRKVTVDEDTPDITISVIILLILKLKTCFMNFKGLNKSNYVLIENL